MEEMKSKLSISHAALYVLLKIYFELHTRQTFSRPEIVIIVPIIFSNLSFFNNHWT